MKKISVIPRIFPENIKSEEINYPNVEDKQRPTEVSWRSIKLSVLKPF